MNKNLKKIIGAIIIIIYLSSLGMECYLVDGIPSIGSFGLIALLLGWMNFDLIGLIWLANPLFLFSLLIYFFSKKKRFAFIFSLLATILAISFLGIDEIYKNEAGQKGQITEYLLGYWLWLSAMVIMLITLSLNKILIKKNYAQQRV